MLTAACFACFLLRVFKLSIRFLIEGFLVVKCMECVSDRIRGGAIVGLIDS